jgi:hypothetical protein
MREDIAFWTPYNCIAISDLTLRSAKLKRVKLQPRKVELRISCAP